MKTIWVAVRDGDAKVRLAVIADLVSIVGISIATVVGTLLTVQGQLNVRATVELAILSLLSLSASALVLAVFMVAAFYISEFFREFRLFRLLLLLALWLAFAALALFAGYGSYLVVSSMSFSVR